MTISLFFAQLLNGFQLGVLLFLMSAGLTLVLGIMNFVNLAHGSLFMMGAYFAAATYGATDSFLLAAAAAVVGTLVLGLIIVSGWPQQRLRPGHSAWRRPLVPWGGLGELRPGIAGAGLTAR